MVIIPALKHNQIQQVEIPTPSELFKKYGLTTAAGKYSGDEILNPNESKIDQVSEVARDAFEPKSE